MVGVFFTDQKVTSFEGANTTDQELFRKIFHQMLERGVYLPPSPFEAFFLSNAMTVNDITAIISSLDDSLLALKG